MPVHVPFAALLAIMLFSTTCLAADPSKTLPFTADEDQDGARTVWFLLNAGQVPGVRYAYTPANEIPKSNRWLELQPGTPLQTFDMAWWPNAVALLEDRVKGRYIFKNQRMPLVELERIYGKPSFRRFSKAEKPLALALFKKNKKAPEKLPAILPESVLYDAIFDLAINATGPRCIHNPNNVWVSIADTDEKRVYEIDNSGCITGEGRKVDKEFSKLITKMEREGAFR